MSGTTLIVSLVSLFIFKLLVTWPYWKEVKRLRRLLRVAANLQNVNRHREAQGWECIYDVRLDRFGGDGEEMIHGELGQP